MYIFCWSIHARLLFMLSFVDILIIYIIMKNYVFTLFEALLKLVKNDARNYHNKTASPGPMHSQ